MKITVISKSIRKIYNNSSLLKKIMFSYGILLSFLPILIFAVLIPVSNNSLQEQIVYSAKKTFSQTSAFLSYKIEKIIKVSDYLAQDGTLNQIINKSANNYPLIDQVQDMHYIQSFLHRYQEEDEIRRIQIFVNSGLLYSEENVNIGNINHAKKTLWYSKLAENKEKVLFMPFQYISPDEPGKKILSVARIMKQQHDYTKLAGLLRLDIAKKNIETILKDADSTEDSVTFLVNHEKLIVASSNPEILISLNIFDKSIPYSTEESDYRKQKIGNESVLTISKRIPGTDWTMVSIVPDHSFMYKAKIIRNTLSLIAVFIIALSYFLAYILSHTITRRISNLSAKMQHISINSELVPFDGKIYKDEVGVLYGSFNKMIYRIRQLMGEQREMGQQLKHMELLALQAQINPHFLYNTLDVIKWLAYRQRSDDIDKVVTSLARFYRLSLAKGDAIVPVRDEIAHVESYMKIQNTRFKDKIRFNVDVPEYARSCSMPKMTLQPIVENSMYHGILNKRDKRGTITIYGIFDAGKLILTVEDDGAGVLVNPLEENTRSDAESGHNHYGLYNINQRIKLTYGSAFGLNFTSFPGAGTKVSICLPESNKTGEKDK